MFVLSGRTIVPIQRESLRLRREGGKSLLVLAVRTVGYRLSEIREMQFPDCTGTEIEWKNPHFLLLTIAIGPL